MLRSRRPRPRLWRLLNRAWSCRICLQRGAPRSYRQDPRRRRLLLARGKKWAPPSSNLGEEDAGEDDRSSPRCGVARRSKNRRRFEAGGLQWNDKRERKFPSRQVAGGIEGTAKEEGETADLAAAGRNMEGAAYFFMGRADIRDLVGMIFRPVPYLFCGPGGYSGSARVALTSPTLGRPVCCWASGVARADELEGWATRCLVRSLCQGR